MEIINNGKERGGNSKAHSRVRIRGGAAEVVMDFWKFQYIRVSGFGFLESVDT